MFHHKLCRVACRMAMILAGLLLVSCASTRSEQSSDADYRDKISLLDSSAGSFGNQGQESNTTRSSAGFESAVGLLGKTLVVDPLVRPFSTVKALYGLTIKSTGGFIERTFIEKLRFPMLERKPIPEVSHALPMDLKTWELHLDTLTSTRSTRGTIRFLVDGEQYFDRLSQVVSRADKSIDIRTYIFDNDDVALQFADLLR